VMDRPGYENASDLDVSEMEAGHAWLEVGGETVDITVDQFNEYIDSDPYPPVYIGSGDNRFVERGRELVKEWPLYKELRQKREGLRSRWLSRRADATMYHGTSGDFADADLDPERGEMGTHFGTPEQANERLDDGGNFDTAHMEPNRREKHIKDMRRMRVIPADIELKNPLRLRDRGTFDISRTVIGDQFVQAGILSQSELRRIRSLGEDDNGRFRNRALQAAIVNAGYDGIVYLNGERASVIVLLPMGCPGSLITMRLATRTS